MMYGGTSHKEGGRQADASNPLTTMTMTVSPHRAPDVKTRVVVLEVVNARLEVVIHHGLDLVDHGRLNRVSGNDGAIRVVRARHVDQLSLCEDGVDVLGVTSSNQEVLGLRSVGDDRQKPARNEQPHQQTPPLL